MSTKHPRSPSNSMPSYFQDPFTGRHGMHQGGEIKESPADEGEFWVTVSLGASAHHGKNIPLGLCRLSQIQFHLHCIIVLPGVVHGSREARTHSCLTCHPADRWCESEVACGTSTGKITFWSHWRWSSNQVMLERTGGENKQRLGCSCLCCGSLQFRRIFAFLSLPILEPL